MLKRFRPAEDEPVPTSVVPSANGKGKGKAASVADEDEDDNDTGYAGRGYHHLLHPFYTETNREADCLAEEIPGDDDDGRFFGGGLNNEQEVSSSFLQLKSVLHPVAVGFS